MWHLEKTPCARDKFPPENLTVTTAPPRVHLTSHWWAPTWGVEEAGTCCARHRRACRGTACPPSRRCLCNPLSPHASRGIRWPPGPCRCKAAASEGQFELLQPLLRWKRWPRSWASSLSPLPGRLEEHKVFFEFIQNSEQEHLAHKKCQCTLFHTAFP